MISGFRPSLGFLSGVAGASVFVAASTDNISLLALCGSPGSPGTYTVTINAGVVIGTSSTGIAAVVTGTFPTGSIVNLINKGNIYGKEGVAGIGAPGPNSASGTAGSPAGPAVSLSYALTIDNTSGNIFGGGGGGAGGDALVFNDSAGNGGDGQGFTNQSAPGAGSPGVAGSGTAGGAGGAWGAAGTTVTSSGGTGGNAVVLNGNAVTWTGGNNGTQVKGAVS